MDSSKMKVGQQKLNKENDIVVCDCHFVITGAQSFSVIQYK